MSNRVDTSPHGPDQRRLLRLAAPVVVFVAWLVAYAAAQWMAYAPHASLWFPPAAVAFAAVAALGWRRASVPLLAASATASAVTLMGHSVPPQATEWTAALALFPIAHVAAFGLAAQATLASVERGPAPSLPRTVGTFLVAGALASALAAWAGTWTMHWAGMLGRDSLLSTALPWWIGDYAGLTALGPLMLLGLRRLSERARLPVRDVLYAFDALPRPSHARGRLLPKLALVLGLALAGLVALAAAPEHESLLFPVFLAIVLQLWIAHTQGMLDSLLSVAVFSIALVAAVAALDLGDHALTLQFAMITLAAGSYFGLAIPVLYTDNSNLRRLLTHDSMTGACSRAFFLELAEQARQSTLRRGEPVAVLMVDLDNLKTLNDSQGHAAGDAALVEVAQACRGALRREDIFGRLGGDEFSAVLPGCSAAQAERVAHTIQGSLVQARVSIGIAIDEHLDASLREVMDRADAALYTAKRSGRGRVEMARPAGGPPPAGRERKAAPLTMR